MLANAISSSSCGALPISSAQRWPRTSALSPRRSTYSKRSGSPAKAASHVLHVAWDVVEGGVAVGLVVRRVEEGRLVLGCGGRDGRRGDDPERGALAAAGEQGARGFPRPCG